MAKKKCEFKVWEPISKKEFIELYKQGKIVSVAPCYANIDGMYYNDGIIPKDISNLKKDFEKTLKMLCEISDILRDMIWNRYVIDYLERWLLEVKKRYCDKESGLYLNYFMRLD